MRMLFGSRDATRELFKRGLGRRLIRSCGPHGRPEVPRCHRQKFPAISVVMIKASLQGRTFREILLGRNITVGAAMEPVHVPCVAAGLLRFSSDSRSLPICNSMKG